MVSSGTNVQLLAGHHDRGAGLYAINATGLILRDLVIEGNTAIDNGDPNDDSIAMDNSSISALSITLDGIEYSAQDLTWTSNCLAGLGR